MDYRSFGPPGSHTQIGATGVRWWRESGDDLVHGITSTIDFLQKHQAPRLTQYMVSTRLYGNLALVGLNGLTYSKLAAVTNALRERISYNICSSVTDTIVAKMAKNKPKPLFLGNGADYRIKRKAQKLNQYCDGIFYENHAHDLGCEAFRDACIWGTGAIKVFACNGRVRFERVLTHELYVDEVEGFYGYPRQMHHVKAIDREVVAETWPGHDAAIRACTGLHGDDLGSSPNISDMIQVRESWHLPSGPDAKDGKHIISIDNAVLFSEPWTKEYFPFALVRWVKRPYGFWGQGVVERLQNIQLEINKLLWVVQRAMHLGAAYKVFLRSGSKVVKEHINNEIGAIVEYTGDAPPQYVVPPLVPGEVYEHLMRLQQLGFQQEGVSMMSAASTKPSGINSGRGLRELDDIETDRFAVAGHSYENLYLDLARLAIDCAKDIAEEEGGYEVRSTERNFVQTIDWKDIDLSKDEYVMQCYPVSSLPDDPAGRLETITEYMQAGILSIRQGRRLLDFPDLDRVEGLANAEEDLLTSLLEKIVDDGKYVGPTPYDDLALARELALQFYAQGRVNGLEPEKLTLLEQFLSDLDRLSQPPPGALPPGPPAPSQPGTSPLGVPSAPPVSPMLPNAPGTATPQ